MGLEFGMTIEELQRRHRTKPFQPFTVNLTDGRAFKVNHPEFLAFTGGGRVIAIGDEREGGFEIIDLLLVTSLTLPPARGNGTNGHKRAKR